jgi:hypothetical protein
MKIEQVDREAAAELYLALDGDELTPSIVAEADRHRRGDYDLSPAVQAFARHRIQALEEAAKVARGAGSHSVGGGDGGTYVIGTALDAYHAIRARFLHPGDGVNDPAANGD